MAKCQQCQIQLKGLWKFTVVYPPFLCQISTFFQCYWAVIDTEQHCISLRLTMWWVDTRVCCKMISTVRLVNTSVQPLRWLHFLCVVRTPEIYSLSNFHVRDTVSATVSTMLCARSLELTHRTTEVWALWPASPHFPTPTSWRPLIYSLLLWVRLF